ncbi:hypothetical protein SKAU_G00216150 [Synaphobranchus kaupii]|uniref:Peptidase S8/S53 domain-containing protein n=1 Tax=Synaphobranchus kaupii TaxID=118154 RepID=A0A9Q1IVJ7_SYNKA|nr:hypothetical protein SKAU_G00216150 [Synaphobranchus kaupii]
MEAKDSFCGVGITFNVRIGGIRLLDGIVTDSTEAPSLNYNSDFIDIYTCCWGPKDNGVEMVKVSNLDERCVTHFSGTSSAAPIAAGVLALVLEANPDLTWRDVQHLLKRQRFQTQWSLAGLLLEQDITSTTGYYGSARPLLHLFDLKTVLHCDPFPHLAIPQCIVGYFSRCGHGEPNQMNPPAISGQSCAEMLTSLFVSPETVYTSAETRWRKVELRMRSRGGHEGTKSERVPTQLEKGPAERGGGASTVIEKKGGGSFGVYWSALVEWNPEHAGCRCETWEDWEAAALQVPRCEQAAYRLSLTRESD